MLIMPRTALVSLSSIVWLILGLHTTHIVTDFLDSSVLTVLMFGHGAWGNVTIPAEVFPKHAVGTVSGLGGTLGGAAGILSQLAIRGQSEYPIQAFDIERRAITDAGRK